MKALALLAAASAASAHTIFVQLDAGGKTYPVSHGIRTPVYDGPITDVTSNCLAVYRKTSKGATSWQRGVHSI